MTDSETKENEAFCNRKTLDTIPFDIVVYIANIGGVFVTNRMASLCRSLRCMLIKHKYVLVGKNFKVSNGYNINIQIALTTCDYNIIKFIQSRWPRIKGINPKIIRSHLFDRIIIDKNQSTINPLLDISDDYRLFIMEQLIIYASYKKLDNNALVEFLDVFCPLLNGLKLQNAKNRVFLKDMCYLSSKMNCMLVLNALVDYVLEYDVFDILNTENEFQQLSEYVLFNSQPYISDVFLMLYEDLIDMRKIFNKCIEHANIKYEQFEVLEKNMEFSYKDVKLIMNSFFSHDEISQISKLLYNKYPEYSSKIKKMMRNCPGIEKDLFNEELIYMHKLAKKRRRNSLSKKNHKRGQRPFRNMLIH